MKDQWFTVVRKISIAERPCMRSPGNVAQQLHRLRRKPGPSRQK